MSNIFGTNTTSDLMSVAETAQKIMQGKSLTEDWLEAEMRKVQHKWPRTNPKIKKQWLDKQKARAEKDGMDMSAGGEFEDRLDDYELTIHADDKVWTEASKIKSKWKKMSTAQRTKWLDKIDDLARKQNTSDEDVRAIRDEFGLHMSEEVEVAEAVLDEALKPRDKAVIDAFYSRKGNLASNLLSVEGGKLTKMGMGGQEIAIWKNDKIVINAKMDVKSTEEIVRYMKKSIPSGVFEEVEIAEGWKAGKYTIKDDKGKILGTYSSGGKAQKAMNDLMQKGDYDKLEVAMVEEVEIEESNELQAIMALDDVGIEATINKKDQVVVKKKDLKKAEAALKKSFKKGGAPELHGEEVKIGEKLEKESYGSFITAAAKAKKEGKKTFMMGGKKYPVTIKQKISAAYEEAEVEEAKLYAAKGTAYPATIDTLKMIVKDKQNQTIMFKDGKAMVDLFTASAMTQVYDALKKPEIKKSFEKMILDKAGFLKAQGFAMKMISGK